MSDSENNSATSVEDDEDYQTNSKMWNTERIIDTAEELERYFSENRFWAKAVASSNKDDKKQYYYCNVNGRNLPNKCPAELCVLQKRSKTNHILLRTKEHNHAGNQSKKITTEVRKIIKDYLEQGFKQRLISDKLRANKNIIPRPTENQVCNIKFNSSSSSTTVNAKRALSSKKQTRFLHR